MTWGLEESFDLERGYPTITVNENQSPEHLLYWTLQTVKRSNLDRLPTFCVR